MKMMHKLEPGRQPDFEGEVQAARQEAQSARCPEAAEAALAKIFMLRNEADGLTPGGWNNLSEILHTMVATSSCKR